MGGTILVCCCVGFLGSGKNREQERRELLRQGDRIIKQRQQEQFRQKPEDLERERQLRERAKEGR
jgi:hypothetical protein